MNLAKPTHAGYFFGQSVIALAERLRAGNLTSVELTRAALEDRGPYDLPDDRPTAWRLITVIAFAVVALAIVFWKR